MPDLLDGSNSTSFVRKDASNDINPGVQIRFGHANQTGTADGSISAGIHASGLNIVGTQTVGGEGRVVRLWGNTTIYGNLTANTFTGTVSNADLLDNLDSTNFLRREAGVWQSASDGLARFYYANNGRTYLRGPNSGDHILTMRSSNDADRLHVSQDGNIWLAALGNWITNFLNQGVRTDSNPTFNNAYITALGGWITDRLGQDVRANSQPNFNNIWLGYMGDWLSNRLDQSVKTDANPYFGTANTRTSIGNNGSIRLLRTTSAASPDTNGFIDFTHNDTDYVRLFYQASVNQFNMLYSTAGGVSLFVQGPVKGMGAYQNLSDLRSKKDIQNISYGLADVMKLRPVTFQWKEQANDWQKGRKVGLIAQEVQTVLPEVVATASDTSKTLSIAYGDIVPVLIKSIQELKAENDALQTRLKRLETHTQGKTRT